MDLQLGLRRSMVWLLLVLFGGCGFPAFQAKATRNTTVKNDGPVNLVIDTSNGAVTVVCEPGLEEIQVQADLECRGKSLQEAEDRVQQAELVVDTSESGQLKLSTKFPAPSVGGDSGSITVKAPSVDSVRVVTSNGSVSVDGQMAAINGAVDLKTSNGRVSLTRVSGDVVAASSNGSIIATDVGGRLNLKSSNGKIEANLLEGQKGPVNIATSNGSVVLSLPSDFQGQVVGKTSNGSMRVDDPNKVVTKSNIDKQGGVISVGAGEDASTITTSNGSIEIKVGN